MTEQRWRFSTLRFTRMFAGGDGAPRHAFPHCPHVKRMMGSTNVVRTYNLGPDSRTLNLIRCKWCRSLYLILLTDDPEMPAETIGAFALVPKDRSTEVSA